MLKPRQHSSTGRVRIDQRDHHADHSNDVARRIERRARRERRREERIKKSTLKGEKYDSPLRRWVRWMSLHELGQWSLVVVILAAGVLRAVISLASRYLGTHHMTLALCLATLPFVSVWTTSKSLTRPGGTHPTSSSKALYTIVQGNGLVGAPPHSWYAARNAGGAGMTGARSMIISKDNRHN